MSFYIDLQHQICTRLFKGRLALAPIDQPTRVLDFGTGTGIWAIEYGKVPLDEEVYSQFAHPWQHCRTPTPMCWVPTSARSNQSCKSSRSTSQARL